MQHTGRCWALPTFLFLLIVLAVAQQPMDCYNSSHPAAENATLLYDDNNNDEHFWSRSSLDDPLPPCSSSSPPDSGCLVCVDQAAVFVLCRNLPHGVIMVMETERVPVDPRKSECPKPPSDDAAPVSPPSAPPPTQLPATGEKGDWKWHLLFLLLLPVLAIIVILVLKYKLWTRIGTPKNRKEVKDAVDSTELEPVAKAAV